MLHVFDMDGTLLRDTTASLEISKHQSCLQQIEDLEKQFDKGFLTTKVFAQEVYKLWSGLNETAVESIFENSPWIQDIERVMSDIREKGEHSIVITMSPNFFADRLRKFGVAEVYSSTFPPLPFNDPIDVSKILTPNDKVTITHKNLEHLNLKTSECIAYGDSGSDIPLFKYIKNNISINGTSSLLSLAQVNYIGNNLFEAYQISREKYIQRS